MKPITHSHYMEAARFPALDGVRAICALMVVTIHMNIRGQTWRWLSGSCGVTGFFVLSGYLITMLCLREEANHGKVSMAAFYARRTFRIFPAYFAVLGLYCAITFAGSHARVGYLMRALPYYLTYMNEFAPPGPFYQSWSLGVEEKYYLVWPLLAFIMLKGRPRSRLALAVTLLVLCETVVRMIHLPSYCQPPSHYRSILVGCILAICLHEQRLFARLSLLATPAGRAVSVASLLALHVAMPIWPGASLLYPYAVACVLCGLLLADGKLSRILSHPVSQYLGRRSYGFYLMHTLAIAAVEAGLPTAGPWWHWNKLAGVICAAALAFGMADVLYRFLEAPCIRVGHRISRRVGHAKAPLPERSALAMAA